jgi:hypothetical protein
MKETFYDRVYDVLKNNFPNHKETNYEMVATYLCSLLIIKRDEQLTTIMRRGKHR